MYPVGSTGGNYREDQESSERPIRQRPLSLPLPLMQELQSRLTLEAKPIESESEKSQVAAKKVDAAAARVRRDPSIEERKNDQSRSPGLPAQLNNQQKIQTIAKFENLFRRAKGEGWSGTIVKELIPAALEVLEFQSPEEGDRLLRRLSLAKEKSCLQETKQMGLYPKYFEGNKELLKLFKYCSGVRYVHFVKGRLQTSRETLVMLLLQEAVLKNKLVLVQRIEAFLRGKFKVVEDDTSLSGIFSSREDRAELEEIRKQFLFALIVASNSKKEEISTFLQASPILTEKSSSLNALYLVLALVEAMDEREDSALYFLRKLSSCAQESPRIIYKLYKATEAIEEKMKKGEESELKSFLLKKYQRVIMKKGKKVRMMARRAQSMQLSKLSAHNWNSNR